jgi:hypothetical protein
MVSVRGYHFGYKTELSEQTTTHAEEAVAQIIEWAEGL